MNSYYFTRMFLFYSKGEVIKILEVKRQIFDSSPDY